MGHLDADGDLDVITVGNNFTFVNNNLTYHNQVGPVNLAPDPPTNLQASFQDQTLRLSWSPATDDKTESRSLTYEYYIRNESGDYFVSDGTFDHTSGNSTASGPRSLTNSNSWHVNDLPSNQNYFWSVRSVDNAFNTSPFAEERSLNLLTSVPEMETALKIYPNPVVRGLLFIDVSSGANQIKKVRLVNVVGHEFTSYSIAFEGNRQKIDLTSLPPGLYLLEIETTRKVLTKKVIISK